MMSEQAQIEAILDRYEQAVIDRDADAVLADYTPDAIGYDLAPPLQHGPKPCSMPMASAPGSIHGRMICASPMPSPISCRMAISRSFTASSG